MRRRRRIVARLRATLTQSGKVRLADDPLGTNLVLGASHVSLAVLGAFGIRRIIKPAMSTAVITSLSPQENDVPVRVLETRPARV